MSKMCAAIALCIVCFFVGACGTADREQGAKIDPADTYWGADSDGNPIGKRAGGRFEYVQYDDAMEVLKDTQTGREYLVWYWRDDVEVVPL